MSTDYFIFACCDDIHELLARICTVEGVQFDGRTLEIAGLLYVRFEELGANTREIMRSDFGEFGIEVNWRISGTYDKSSDTDDLIWRLLRCAAVIINANPNSSLSIMREAESFYLFNSKDQLLISSVYKGFPNVASLFEKPCVMKYLG
jgi:hypothetical protein